MYSTSFYQIFIQKEGKFFIEFPRNMKSRQPGIVRSQKFTGDKMRGQVMEIILENSEDGEVWLSNFEVNATKSI